MDAADRDTTKGPTDEFFQLIFDWGEVYAIVHEGDRWEARRRDCPDHLLTAASPSELRAAIRADYHPPNPVPRDLDGEDGDR